MQMHAERTCVVKCIYRVFLHLHVPVHVRLGDSVRIPKGFHCDLMQVRIKGRIKSNAIYRMHGVRDVPHRRCRQHTGCKRSLLFCYATDPKAPLNLGRTLPASKGFKNSASRAESWEHVSGMCQVCVRYVATTPMSSNSCA